MLKKFNDYLKSFFNKSTFTILDENDTILDEIEIKIELKTNLYGTYYLYDGETKRGNYIIVKFLLDTHKEPDTYEIFTMINGAYRSVGSNALENCEDKEDRKEELKIIRNTRIEILKHFRTKYNPQFVISKPAFQMSEEERRDFLKRVNNNKTAIAGAGFVIEDKPESILDDLENAHLIKARNPNYKTQV
jgi:hypothetical protein